MIADYTKLIDKVMKRLFPICRSITGKGNRESLSILQEIAPLKILEYPSGTKVYDWVIPDEWDIIDAWIKNGKGKKIVDFRENNLHVVNYSTGINTEISGVELKKHLNTLSNYPEAIPYRTSYYKRDWGFCLSENVLNTEIQDDAVYHVKIDAKHFSGSLSLGELVLKGKRSEERLISTYICHPSLANDNLSGAVLTAILAEVMSKRVWNYTYRFLWVPETIGAIAYMSQNQEIMRKITEGLLVTTVGGPGLMGFKCSWDISHPYNAMIRGMFKRAGEPFIEYPFDLHGSDERQYSAPGNRINMVSITKDKYYEYPEYHTSFDNLNFVSAGNIQKSLEYYVTFIENADRDEIYERLEPGAEIMLSRYGLYPEGGGGMIPGKSGLRELDQILGLLFFCDGKTDLFRISEMMNQEYDLIKKLAENLEEKGIIRRKL